MKLIITLSLLFSFSALAEVTPAEVNSMIDQMVSKQVISAEEAEKAKLKMKAMSPEQWGQVNSQAAKIAARSPASANVASQNKIEEVHGIDLDSAQFKQIQEDMKAIVKP